MRVISLAGSPRIPSRSAALLALSQNWLRQQGVDVTVYTLHDFDAEDLLYANFNSPAIKAFADQLAQADGLLISTPVYKASFSGALKTLLDLLPERALDHKVVLPLATGGSIGHMLAVDYALKPVLAALKAQEVLHGVFADDSQIQLTGEGATLTDAVAARLEEALADFIWRLAAANRPRCASRRRWRRVRPPERPEKESLNEKRIALRRWLSAATLTGLLSLVWANAAAAQDPAQFRIGYQKGRSARCWRRATGCWRNVSPPPASAGSSFPPARRCWRP